MAGGQGRGKFEHSGHYYLGGYRLGWAAYTLLSTLSLTGANFGRLPNAAILANLGIGPSTSSALIPSLGDSSTSKPVVVAPGLPALKKSLVDSILAGHFVDFTELPPAKGRTKAFNSRLDGQIVILQAAEYLQAKRLIPDLGIWIQCFSLYAAVVLSKFPERRTSLLLYQSTIAKLSQKFNWPSWVMYDTSYRQEAADTGKYDWSKIEPSLHAQCFVGMAISSEGWCSLCHSVEHLRHNCPLSPQLPPREAPKRPPPESPPTSYPKRFKEWPPICRKFNKHDWHCEFMPKCNYRHICLKCHGPHPETKCTKQGAAGSQSKLQ